VKQLTGLDAAFLYMETPTTFGHVTALMIFERPNPDYNPYAAVYAKYASLVGQLEPLRRRLVGVPFGLDHPYWVADPNFDLDFHVREIHLARPGMVDQLAEQVSRIVGRPMDRSRPLWEVYVIDGLHSGRWALLTKYHHATIDGAAGQLMLNILTDTDPDGPAPGPGPSWQPEPLPGNIDLLRLLAVAASVLREKKATVDLTTQQIEDAISALDPSTRAAVIGRLTADAVQQVKDRVDR
jgi:diacylglycerol O-acyltransferase / wax synthase